MNYLEIALRLAEEVMPVAHAKVAAIIVYKNTIISFGINQRKSHPIQKEFSKNEEKISLHAEMSAIINARRYLTVDQMAKSSLYIARAKHPDHNRNVWIPGLAKPCVVCQRAIEVYGIKDIRWTC
jgi:deoxycytidylate deaminase